MLLLQRKFKDESAIVNHMIKKRKKTSSKTGQKMVLGCTYIMNNNSMQTFTIPQCMHSNGQNSCNHKPNPQVVEHMVSENRIEGNNFRLSGSKYFTKSVFWCVHWHIPLTVKSWKVVCEWLFPWRKPKLKVWSRMHELTYEGGNCKEGVSVVWEASE